MLGYKSEYKTKTVNVLKQVIQKIADSFTPEIPRFRRVLRVQSNSRNINFRGRNLRRKDSQDTLVNEISETPRPALIEVLRNQRYPAHLSLAV
ncbi:hypothetical protein AYI70_g7435 [Smittium culicis]|uniref:Uncharacterized protein n=1 Tax=Smittium culicis TaxID=133412 RepID=A0A1R1XKQ1_9FUNG|nr:hypothetical protein AYI70_g7435 [Smittium culicis]